jgi:MFS family permease
MRRTERPVSALPQTCPVNTKLTVVFVVESIVYSKFIKSNDYKWWVVLMLWFVCFFNYADRQAIYAVFPKLKEEFGFDKVQLGLIGSAFMWVYAAGLMNTVGWGGGALGPLFVGIASKYGSKPTEMQNMSDAIAWCGAVYIIGSVLMLAAMYFFGDGRSIRNILKNINGDNSQGV